MLFLKTSEKSWSPNDGLSWWPTCLCTVHCALPTWQLPALICQDSGILIDGTPIKDRQTLRGNNVSTHTYILYIHIWDTKRHLAIWLILEGQSYILWEETMFLYIYNSYTKSRFRQKNLIIAFDHMIKCGILTNTPWDHFWRHILCSGDLYFSHWSFHSRIQPLQWPYHRERWDFGSKRECSLIPARTCRKMWGLWR